MTEPKKRQSELKAAMTSYDAEVFERGKREIEVSFQQSYDSTHWEAYMQSAAVKHDDRPVARR